MAEPFTLAQQRNFILRMRNRRGFYPYELERLEAVANSLDELLTLHTTVQAIREKHAPPEPKAKESK